MQPYSVQKYRDEILAYLKSARDEKLAECAALNEAIEHIESIDIRPDVAEAG